MLRRLRLQIVAILAAFVFMTQADAETGMCLVVCRSDAASGPGDIRRIDFKDNAVIRTSGVIGNGDYPRFSPDGSQFAYISGTTVNSGSTYAVLL